MLRLVTLAVSAALLASPVIAQDNVDDLRLAAEAGDSSAAFNYGYAMTFPENGDPDFAIGRYWLVQADRKSVV